MTSTPRPTRPLTRRRPRLRLVVATALAALAPFALAGCGGGDAEAGPRLATDAAIPAEVPEGTVLRIGDPVTQAALELSGLDDELDFDVEWANISGGPKTLEAFRANALDVGAVADIPPLFATWTDTDVRIVAARTTTDPLEHPVYELGIAPGVDVDDVADLRGKRIAYSPGQAQGALVLRVLEQAGLTQQDVELVEIASVDDVYVNALGSNQVDVAPLGQALVPPFLAKYERDGARTLSPGIRDDYWNLYVPAEVVQDAGKAAALKQYTEVWAEAVDWINEHPDELAQGYYVEREGLSEADAAAIVEANGDYEVPPTWDEFITDHQATADLLAREQDREPLDVAALYDRRFQPEGAEGQASARSAVGRSEVGS